MLSNLIQFGCGRQSVMKGCPLAVLTVAVFAILQCNASGSTDAVVKDVVKRGYGPAVPGPNINVPWNPTYVHNPCYLDYGELVCGPAVYLIGIQYAGLVLLRKAIDLHPDIDCYSTGFFSEFSDMTGDHVINVYDIKQIANDGAYECAAIQQSDIENYLSLFANTTKIIDYGDERRCICDSGPDLARPYDLDLNAGVLSAPEVTTASALADLYNGMKVIVILRDPTVRFIREYCALGIATPFAEYVDDAIAEFIECESNATREDTSCVYDARLSGLLQAGLYDFLIEQDLNRSISNENFLLLTWDHLVNDATRNATMESIFNFLGKDLPPSNDLYWDALDALFGPKTGNCNGQTIDDASKQKLRDFYSTRATIYLGLGPAP